jgi:hypothetical protein
MAVCFINFSITYIWALLYSDMTIILSKHRKLFKYDMLYRLAMATDPFADIERFFDEMIESLMNADIGIGAFGPTDFNIEMPNNTAGDVYSAPRKCDVGKCTREGRVYPIGQRGLSLCPEHFKQYRDAAFRRLIKK